MRLWRIARKPCILRSGAIGASTSNSPRDKAAGRSLAGKERAQVVVAADEIPIDGRPTERCFGGEIAR